jgi:hypothetical protein
MALVQAFFLSAALGCGSKPKRDETGKNPFKGRQQTQKEKSQDKFMKPDQATGPDF